MRRNPLIGLFLACTVGTGCAPADDVPPPAIIDSGFDGQTVFPGPVVPSDGGSDLGDEDMGEDDGCLDEPLDARVLFVIDRSDTMGEIATGGDNVAFNVIASQAADQLLDSLPATSTSALMLFPSQTLDEPTCNDVDALAQQYGFREPAMMQTLLGELWSMESLILSKPRARAMQRAAEAVTELDLSDVLVVVFSDNAIGCTIGTETNGLTSLTGRGARVMQITVGTSSSAGTVSTPPVYSRVSEIVDALEPVLDDVLHRCEEP